MKEARAPFSWAEFAGKLGAVTALIGVWLWLVGWSWAYHWFASFGIGISSVGLDTRALPLWGMIAVLAYWWQTAIGLGALVLAGVAGTRGRIAPDIMVVLIAFVLVGAFAMGFWLGHLKADSDRRVLAALNWPDTTPVQFELAGEGPEPLAELARDSRSGCWRVLYSDARRFYLFRPLPGRPSSNTIVFLVDRDDLALVRLGPSGAPLCAR